MIRKVLVANRGEIACRIMRTCAEMGIATAGVFSDVDAGALHVQAAGEAVRLGGPSASDSYLNIPALLEATARTGADAIHPGYGFLAENASFAAACREAGITFIGPEPEVIARMGSKREAKLLMAAAGLPVVPGYLGEDQSEARFLESAEAAGYPVMIKAAAGGGGKGMRLVAGSRELPEALSAARREALSAFGDGTLILEKAIVNARHIEFQIFGDAHAAVIHLGERECTIQRRHQKVIEETPSTALTPELRARMAEAAVTAGQQLNYTNAGTVEFLLDPDGNFYFLEINTRLQVEHPVTELVTGLDLVRWQILVAEGYPLPLKQEMVTFSGHAVEARVYAEDPSAKFLPATGQILRWSPPLASGVRVDAGIQTGDGISAYYDPLLAKISAWGNDRGEALRRLDQALASTVLLGLPSNIAFLRRVLLHPAHQAGIISTGFIEEHADYLLGAGPAESERALAAAAVTVLRYQSRMPGTGLPMRRWRNNPDGPIRERYLPSQEVSLQPRDANQYEATITLEGHIRRTLSITVQDAMHYGHGTTLVFEVDGHLMRVMAERASPSEWWVQVNNGASQLLRWVSPLPEPEPAATSRHSANGQAVSPRPQSRRLDSRDASVTAPMSGTVISVLVSEGQRVGSGDPLVILSAMKMEHTVRATREAVVTHIYCQPGEQVAAAGVLLELLEPNARSDESP